MRTRPRSRRGFHRVAALFLFCAPMSASGPGVAAGSLAAGYSHRVWRAQDGLPQNAIRVITQTPDGYLWIGSPGGLVRFDGSRFTVFDRSNTPAFHDDSILSLCPSRDGSLWIGLEGGGLLKYRGGAFQVFGAPEGLTNGFVRALHEDSSGTLWVGTDRGFFRLAAGKLERLDGSRDIPVTAITSISQAAGKIWAAGGIGLLVVEGDQVRLFQPRSSALNGMRTVHATDDGKLWVSTAAGLKQLENGMLRGEAALDRIRALTLCNDHSGNLWIGTLGDGLVRLGATGAAEYRAPAVLPDNTVFAIFEDREQNLWVGTQDGLLRLSKAVVHTLSSRDGLSDDNVSTVYESRDGTLWMTTITGRIYRRTPPERTGKLTPFVLPAPFARLRARTVIEDRSGVLWIGTEFDGVIRIAADGKPANFTTRDGLRNNSVREFLEDRDGGLWIALGSGLSRWDGRQFRNYYIEDGLAYGSVRKLMLDHNGDLLVGTDGGLNRIHQGRFVADAAFAQLAGERIWAMFEDAGRVLWVGTRGGGLFRIAQGKTARITAHDGLPGNTIYQILQDARGSLWLSGPSGAISVTRAELNRVADGGAGPIAGIPVGTAEGMESTQLNGGIGEAGWRSAAGELWFPSVKGAVRIDPAAIRPSLPSPVLIEAVTADDRPIPLSGEIRIPPGHGKLEIHYTACSLLSPERTRFQYALEGFDEGWTAGSSDRIAHYTNLPQGRYRFRVKAADSVAPNQGSEASVAFFWEPHLYQTRWFYALCAALAGAGAWAALRFYTLQTKARYALLLSERTRLAREMHDTIIQGCVGVSTLLEAASGLGQGDPGKMRDFLDQARIQVRLTLDEARQAVWDLRHSGLEGEISGMLREFVRPLSAETGVPITVETAGSPAPLEGGTLRSMFLVAREAVRNAVTHSSAHRIGIRLCFETGEVRLEVVDDGRGFTPPGADVPAGGHYGIVGMRERIEQLGGRFVLRSSPGTGTAVIARLPLGSRRLPPESGKPGA